MVSRITLTSLLPTTNTSHDHVHGFFHLTIPIPRFNNLNLTTKTFEPFGSAQDRLREAVEPFDRLRAG
jgi:hypothetical protein